MPRLVTLDRVATEALRRCDRVNDNALPIEEMRGYVRASYTELYDLLVGAYGDEYFFTEAKLTTTAGTSTFDTSTSDFYKILSVDVVVGGLALPLKHLNWGEHTRYINALATPWPVVYRWTGSSLTLYPTPQGAYPVRVCYIPQAAALSNALVAHGTNVPTVTVSGTAADPDSRLYVKISTGGARGTAKLDWSLDNGATYQATAVVTAATVTLGSSGFTLTMSTGTYATDHYWDQANVFDGINGWEEYVIVDCAIKGAQKQEADVSALMAQKGSLMARIDAMAQSRTMGPATVIDSRSSSALFPYGGGGWW